MELIRLLLLDVEGETKPDLSSYTPEQVTYHTALIVEAELAHGGVGEDGQGYPIVAKATWLSWKGHEFLDAARNDTVWKKTIAKIKAAGASLPLPVLQEILTVGIKNQLGLS